MARMVNIIEYDDETIVEFKIVSGRYQYSFDSWDEAFEALPELDPDFYDPQK